MTRGGERATCYLALPARPNGVGIVLASSLWGLNSDLRSFADYFCKLGYAVVAPNLFWRLRAEHSLEYEKVPPDIIMELAGKSSDPEGLMDLRHADAELRARAGCEQTALIGWCYGGRLACLLAIESVFDAVVAIYPSFLETRLDTVKRIPRPMSLHLPEIEQHEKVPDSINMIVRALAEEPQVETFVYGGVRHGFDFAAPHPAFDRAAARLCDTRVALFLDRILLRHEPVRSGAEPPPA